MIKKRALIALLVVALGIFSVPNSTRASSFTDAALTVLIGSGVGAVLGLSTLPFYTASGEHTRNIWIGAALGAVVGVGYSAFSAVSKTDTMEFDDDYDAADKNDFSLRPLPTRVSGGHLAQIEIQRNNLAPVSVGLAKTNGREAELWSPVATFRF